MLAPIILFVYNRLWHIQQTVESLKNNYLSGESILFIYSDGPKFNHYDKSITDENLKKVEEVRNYIKEINGFKEVIIIKSEKNLGLAESIIKGVTEVINKYGKVIVLEDDMITSPFYLQYMNDALDIYEHDDNVISIHGYIYPIKGKLPVSFFLKGADCWGWATWKRGWVLFEKDGKKLLDTLEKRDLIFDFNFYGKANYLNMLKDQIGGKNDSWAVRWYASAYLNNKLTLYPGKSLVHNIGNDNSGTHCEDSDNFKVRIYSKPLKLRRICIKENNKVKKKFSRFFSDNKIKNKRMNIIKEKVINNLLPPIIIKIYRFLFKKNQNKIKKQIETNHYGWFGNYASWTEAKKETTGYENDLILEKVKNAILKIKKGEAIYERDSVLFDHIEYNWQLLSALLYTSVLNNGRLNVLDFGGSLGSVYYQNKIFFNKLKEKKWCIVEQENFVRTGKELFEDELLKFYYNIDDCLKKESINIILLSSVIQYLEKPYEFIEDIIKKDFNNIIVDLTGFFQGEDRLTIQKVPPNIYKASYPCWIFNEKKFVESFTEKYQLLECFESFIGKDMSIDNSTKFSYKGFIFIRK